MATTDHPDLDLAALRLLTLVADLGSISAAARAEQISQPSASKRIQVLERRLRLELLDRRTRGAQLTPHGQLVTDWCRGVVDSVDRLVTGSRALATVAGAELRVAASQTIAEYLMPAWLGEFRRRGHDLPVNLQVANSQQVIAAVRAREAELGFVETPTVPADLRSRRVATDRLVLVAAPGHPLARRRRGVTASELARLPLASREPGSGTREALHRGLGSAAAPAIELVSNAAVKALVSAGDHPAVLSELTVGNELRDGRLVDIPVSGVDLHRALRAVWRQGTTPHGAASDLLGVTVGLGVRARAQPAAPMRR